MRDPVTMTSCNSGAGSVVAATVCENAAGAAAVAPAIAIAARIAYCNLQLFPICCSLKIQNGYMSYPLNLFHQGSRRSESASGAHAATVNAPTLSLASMDDWLGGTAVGEDSFPRMDGGHLPADRMFLAALISGS